YEYRLPSAEEVKRSSAVPEGAITAPWTSIGRIEIPGPVLLKRREWVHALSSGLVSFAIESTTSDGGSFDFPKEIYEIPNIESVSSFCGEYHYRNIIFNSPRFSRMSIDWRKIFENFLNLSLSRSVPGYQEIMQVREDLRLLLSGI